jgi:hypothetical protein
MERNSKPIQGAQFVRYFGPLLELELGVKPVKTFEVDEALFDDFRS